MSIKSAFPNLQPSLLLDFANVKKLDPRITFSRASTGRVYDGRSVAKAEENLLVRSEDFTVTASWANTGTTDTANTDVAPDGTTTADTLTALNDSVSGNARIEQETPVVNGLPYTFSVFVKNGTIDYVQLFYPSSRFGANAYANFDLTGSGALGTVGASATATITASTNGFFRISITATCTSSGTGSSLIQMIDSPTAARAASITRTGQTAILWGAQLEQRSAVTAYTATTTQPITNYIPALQTAAAGQARFDHNGAESLGLLIEEQRTNLLTYSEEFNDASWNKNNLTVSANIAVSPSGALTADQLVEDAADTNKHIRAINTSLTSGTAVTFSCYIKPSNCDAIAFREGLVSGDAVTYKFSTGTQTSQGTRFSGITATSVGNGWFRLSAVFTPTSNATHQFRVHLLGNNYDQSTNPSVSTYTYTGNGYSGIFIWGAQLEAGAFPTSYIPTTSASVTRSADAASMTGANFSSWYRADEGTMYAEFVRATTSTVARVLQVDDGTSSNRIYIGGGTTGTLVAVVGGTSAAGITSNTIAANQNVKVAGAYKVDNFAVSTSGAAVGTDTSGAIPVVTTARIGVNESGNPYLNGTIKKLSFYPVRCTDAQLIALTQ